MLKRCEVCKEKFYVVPSRYKARKTCSRKCQYQRLKIIIKKYAAQHNRLGSNNPSWKGGRLITKEGYVRIRLPYKRVMEHRLVMETLLGRKLERWEQVHHKNKIRDDNNADNLELVLAQKHKGVMQCPHCRKEFKAL